MNRSTSLVQEFYYSEVSNMYIHTYCKYTHYTYTVHTCGIMRVKKHNLQCTVSGVVMRHSQYINNFSKNANTQQYYDKFATAFSA